MYGFTFGQDEGEATFQLVLMTDGLTSYALVYYMEGGMKWTYRGSWSYVMIGVSYGQVETYQRNFFSKTEAAYSIDSMTGNTGEMKHDLLSSVLLHKTLDRIRCIQREVMTADLI